MLASYLMCTFILMQIESALIRGYPFPSPSHLFLPLSSPPPLSLSLSLSLTHTYTQVVGGCSRCQMICVDQATGLRSPDSLRTLTSVRGSKVTSIAEKDIN